VTLQKVVKVCLRIIEIEFVFILALSVIIRSLILISDRLRTFAFFAFGLILESIIAIEVLNSVIVVVRVAHFVFDLVTVFLLLDGRFFAHLARLELRAALDYRGQLRRLLHLLLQLFKVFLAF